MKRALIQIPLIVVSILLLLGVSGKRGSTPEYPDISRRINAFSFGLLKSYASITELPPNVVLSPQSIFHGLAMSYIASGGKTREELAQAFEFPIANSDLISGLATLKNALKVSSSHAHVDLSIASSIWLDERYADFRNDYIRQVDDGLGAVYHVDFQSPHAAADRVNQWVSNQTRGRIAKVIDAHDFRSKTRGGFIDEPAMVSANAAYFKSDWSCRFDNRETRNKPFFVCKNASKIARLMHLESLFMYSEDNAFQFLEIPYVDHQCAMYLLLPKSRISAQEAVNRITVDELTNLTKTACMYQVDVLLPKFEISSHFDLRSALEGLGVSHAFISGSADFDRMIIKKPEAYRIYLNKIYHDAWMAVDEEGSEAAAVTTTVHYSIGCSAPPSLLQSAVFHADHPFLFAIVHHATGSILFSGWVSDPKG